MNRCPRWTNRVPLAVVLLAFFACAGPADLPEQQLQGRSLALAPLTLRAELSLLSRWSGGYCATIALHNDGSRTVSGWSVDIDLEGSTLSHAWSAEASVSASGLHLRARPDGAVLAPGQQRSLGFCADDTRGAQPTIIEAAGFDLEDAPEGLAQKLTIVSEWDTGYCAEATITNPGPERSWTWAVTVDLHGSTPTHVWSATTSSGGSLLTFRPVHYNAVLEAGGTTGFGFCAQARPGQRPVLVPPDGQDLVHRLTVAVYLPRRIATCFIGDPCSPNSESCVGLRDDANELVEPFTDASFTAVRTTSPSRAGAQKEVCVELVSSDEEHAAALAELELFRENVLEWSHGAIELTLQRHTFEQLDMDLSRWGGGVWIGPWNLAEFAQPELDTAPDFNLVVPPIRDPVLGLHHDLGGCGGTFGADLGIAGAGWSWVPMTGRSFWFECAEQSVLTHEWLHQVHWAYQQLSGFIDLYGWSLPMCGQGDPDPRRWFPDTHQCNDDPDFERCGLSDCGGNDLVNEHVLSAHFDRRVRFVANHCKDGLLNWGETEVDRGANCM